MLKLYDISDDIIKLMSFIKTYIIIFYYCFVVEFYYYFVLDIQKNYFLIFNINEAKFNQTLFLSAIYKHSYLFLNICSMNQNIIL